MEVVMSALATTRQGSELPLEQAFEGFPSEDAGIDIDIEPAVGASPALEPTIPPGNAGAEEKPSVRPVTRPRPSAADELLRRCASLAARARVDAITDLQAPSLLSLHDVIEDICGERPEGEQPPSSPLPCLAIAALEDLRHQLGHRREETAAAARLADVDRALAALRTGRPVGE
jgi:hypothetical protein